jgi:mono/diheme cytochrome c family protein
MSGSTRCAVASLLYFSRVGWKAYAIQRAGEFMKTKYGLAAALIFLGVIAAFAQAARQNPAAQPRQGDVARGKYLVEEVAKCAECHTPRDAQGQLDPSRWLQGAPTWIAPVRPTPNWAYQAPALAGLLAYSDADVQEILEKGKGPNGAGLRPPMHIYHLSRDDTRAIVAYLRSLSSSPR